MFELRAGSCIPRAVTVGDHGPDKQGEVARSSDDIPCGTYPGKVSGAQVKIRVERLVRMALLGRRPIRSELDQDPGGSGEAMCTCQAPVPPFDISSSQGYD